MGGIANGIAYHGGLRPVRRDLPDLLRLHARQRPRRGALRPAGRLRLDPRLGRPRRGRPDPPAGRALRGPARDPEPVVRPAGRRERDGRRLGPRPRADRRADGPGPHPPEAPRPGRHGRDGPRGRPARRLRRPAGVQRGRRRQRPTSSSSPPAPRSSWPSPPPRPSRPRGSPPGSSASPAGRPSRPRTPRTASRSCRRRARKRVAVEIGVSLGWERWAGDEGAIVALDHFGASAPAGTILKELGFTAEAVAERRARGSVRRGGFRGRVAGAAGHRTPEGRPLMRVAFAADHGGAELKAELLAPARRRRPRADRPRRRRLRPATTTTRTSPGAWPTPSATARPTGGSSSAAPGSGRASPPTRSAACGRRSPTTPTRPTRASSTTT